MGKGPENDRRDVLVTLRLSEAEKASWDAEAKERDVPLSQLIRHIVNEHFDNKKSRKSR